MRLRLIFCLTILFCFAGNASAEWYQHEGKGYVLCDAIVKRLNSYQWKSFEERYNCSWHVVASYPGFKEPEWQDLDPKQHERLVSELIEYRTCGADAYFKRFNRIDPAYALKKCSGITPQAKHSFVNDVLEGRVKLQLLRARVLTKRNYIDYTAPTGLQTLIQFRGEQDKKYHLAQCPDKPFVEWYIGGPYVVADDLSGPHAGVTTVGYLSGKVLFLYDGKLHYADSTGGEAQIGIVEDDGYGRDFCDIRFKETKRRSK
jgi:hypothetical protein